MQIRYKAHLISEVLPTRMFLQQGGSRLLEYKVAVFGHDQHAKQHNPYAKKKLLTIVERSIHTH